MKMLRTLRNILLAQVAMACLMFPTLWAAPNLIQNPGFETPAPGVPPGTPVAYCSSNTTSGGYVCVAPVGDACFFGQNSAAAGWQIWVASCQAHQYLYTELLSYGCAGCPPPPPGGGGKHMMHVVTNVNASGIQQLGFGPAQTLSSIWVYVNPNVSNNGCVGMATGAGPGAPNPNIQGTRWSGDETVCETGSWIQMNAPSENSVATQFVVFSECMSTRCIFDPTAIYDFYIDNVDVVAAPTTCTPHCAQDAKCGASDGCGGSCPGSCAPDLHESCRDLGNSGYLCAATPPTCTPHCATDMTCGTSNGCGGSCPGSCAKPAALRESCKYLNNFGYLCVEPPGGP